MTERWTFRRLRRFFEPARLRLGAAPPLGGGSSSSGSASRALGLMFGRGGSPLSRAHLGLEGAHLSAHLKALCALVFEQSEQHLDRGGLLLEGEGRDRR